jgi:hypothetical protein
MSDASFDRVGKQLHINDVVSGMKTADRTNVIGRVVQLDDDHCIIRTVQPKNQFMCVLCAHVTLLGSNWSNFHACSMMIAEYRLKHSENTGILV